MERSIQLIDMPEDSMRHILERCDFVSLQCLRKTCHTFRNFIDETKPSQLNVLDIFGHPGRFSMTFSENTNDKLYPAGTKVRLDFNESGGKNTKITWYRMGRKREKIIENNNYLDVFSRTLGTVLECKQPKWNKISLGCHEEALKKIQESILALTSPLKVHSLRISSCKCLNLVVEIMKSFCPDTLTHLHFDTPSEPWNMSEMVKLEQWKKATELNMRLVIASPTDIESYSHFQYAIIFFENITVDDLCKIRKLFLNTPSITKRFELYGLNSLNKNLLVLKLGEAYLSGDPASNFWFTMENSIQLINMPEDSMRHILERCDFVSIQRLRKTCHTFRNFIDETKPSQLTVLDISGFPGRVSLRFSESTNDNLYPNGRKIKLDYNDLGDGNAMITWHFMDGKRDKIIENNNNLDVFSRDFETVLGCTQQKWDKVSTWCNEDVLKKVQDSLLSLKSPLKVHYLSINSYECPNLVMKIVKLICPGTLARLRLAAVDEHWDMSEMVQLEQWKKAMELDMERVIVSADIENYYHFETAKICFENVTMDDLCKLKKLFLNTPTLTKRFQLYGFNNKSLLITTLGKPYLSGDPASNFWYFKRDDNYVLCMNYTEILKCFDFSIVIKNDIPRDALIL